MSHNDHHLALLNDYFMVVTDKTWECVATTLANGGGYLALGTKFRYFSPAASLGQ